MSHKLIIKMLKKELDNAVNIEDCIKIKKELDTYTQNDEFFIKLNKLKTKYHIIENI